MYQTKPEDQTITPAHLMLTPVDSGNTINFLNFKNIGMNTLSESSAFPKIRNASKVYNTSLIHTPSTFTNKYSSLNSLYINEDNYLYAPSFGLRRQHNLASTSALGNSFASTSLDTQSFEKFLSTNIGLNLTERSYTPLTATSALSLQKTEALNSTSDTKRLESIIQSDIKINTNAQSNLLDYPTLLSSLNDNSDKAGLSYPATKLAVDGVTSSKLHNPNFNYTRDEINYTSSLSLSSDSQINLNKETNPRAFNINGPNSKVLLGEQSLRTFPDLKLNQANFTLSSGRNAPTSNLENASRTNRSSSIYTNTIEARSDYPNSSTLSNLASSRSFISESHPAILSSSINYLNGLDYDATSSLSEGIRYSVDGNLEHFSTLKKGSVGEAFVGSREKTPKSINSAY